MYGYKNTLKL